MAQPIFRSTDPSAPVIDNNMGSLCTTLDAVLVNGYGSKAPLGWTIKFTATNKRVYKMGAGSGFELGVDETTNVYDVKIRGAESYTAIDTYTGGFPTAAQLASGMWFNKTNNTVGARPWIITGDNKRFCMLIEAQLATVWVGAFFGDIVSYKPGSDPYCCMTFGGRIASTSNISSGADTFLPIASNPFTAATPGHYIARAHTGAGSSLNNNKYFDSRGSSMTQMGAGGPPNVYPDPVSGSLQLSRIFITEPSPVYSPRGYVPGIWMPCHDRAAMVSSGVANGDTFNGSDGLVSRTFEYRFANNSATAGAVVFETSNWPESA